MPKPLSGEILKLEIRLTPYDQVRIDLTQFDLTSFTQFVLCEEGEPNGVPKLHYHGYLETGRSISWVRSFLRKMANPPEQEKINGNALFFTKQPHEHSFGYITKYGHVVCRHGVTQTTIDEWIKSSDEYRKQKEATRKRGQRTRADELDAVIEDVESYLKEDHVNRSEACIVARILDICYADKIRFPTKAQMEMFVLKLLYPYDPEVARLYYTRSFQTYRT